jgi:hypothetical protein
MLSEPTFIAATVSFFFPTSSTQAPQNRNIHRLLIQTAGDIYAYISVAISYHSSYYGKRLQNGTAAKTQNTGDASTLTTIR